MAPRYGRVWHAPDRSRTCDPRFRKAVLYPTELRAPAEAQCARRCRDGQRSTHAATRHAPPEAPGATVHCTHRPPAPSLRPGLHPPAESPPRCATYPPCSSCFPLLPAPWRKKPRSRTPSPPKRRRPSRQRPRSSAEAQRPLRGPRRAGFDPTALLTGGGGKPPKPFFELLDKLDGLGKAPAGRPSCSTCPSGVQFNLPQLRELERSMQRVRAAGKKLICYVENADPGTYQVASQCDGS